MSKSTKGHIRISFHELIFVVYIFSFTLLRGVLITFSTKSTLILIANTAILVVVSISEQIFRKHTVYIKRRVIYYIVFFLLFFIIDFLFLNNKLLGQYLYEFFIYGVISMFFFSQVKDYKKCLEYLGIASVLSILIYCLDPVLSYRYFRGYMQLGLECMLPAFLFCHVLRKYMNHKLLVVPEAIAFLELLLFCNRGAFLTAILGCVILEIFYKKKTGKDLVLYLAIILISIIVAINLENILLWIMELLEQHGYNSYSIRTFYRMFTKQITGLSHRDEIWENALDFFWKSPILGNGIASFESTYGMYTHNLLLEILTSMGIVGFLAVFLCILKRVLEIFSIKEEKKLFMITMFVLGIFPLMLSKYIFHWQYFWVFLVGISNKKVIAKNGKEKKKEKEVIEKKEEIIENLGG